MRAWVLMVICVGCGDDDFVPASVTSLSDASSNVDGGNVDAGAGNGEGSAALGTNGSGGNGAVNLDSKPQRNHYLPQASGIDRPGS